MGRPLRIEVAGETNVGMKRTHNEDNFSIFEESGLYVVADGMGGHASGEVASKMAVDALREFFQATAEDPERTWPYKMDRSKGYAENRLITGIKLANLRIYDAAQREARQRGMGTTIVTLFAVEDGVYIAHVGDSRGCSWQVSTLTVSFMPRARTMTFLCGKLSTSSGVSRLALR